MKNLVSKLCSPAGRERGTPRMAAEDLKEMAASTKTIVLLAATRRSTAQDCDGSQHSSPRLPEEAAADARDPSPADRKWPHTSLGRDGSVDRKAWSTRSASFSQSVQPVGVQPVGGHWPGVPVSGVPPDSREGRPGTDLMVGAEA